MGEARSGTQESGLGGNREGITEGAAGSQRANGGKVVSAVGTGS